MSKFIIHSRHMDRQNLHNFLHLLCKIFANSDVYSGIIHLYVHTPPKKADETRHCYITIEYMIEAIFSKYHLYIVLCDFE